jgi:hypothetical protein
MIEQTTRAHLEQLRDLLCRLSDAQFSQPLEVLDGASLGQHVRHVLEFYGCLMESLETGEVNYDNRRRDALMEQSTQRNLVFIDRLLHQIGEVRGDRPMRLSADHSPEGGQLISVPSTYHRELLYNVEHLVHHLALVKIGVKMLPDAPDTDARLGVAVSTQRSRNLCAQ